MSTNIKNGQQGTKLRTVIFLLLVSCFFSVSMTAQCAMCRAALEGEGNTAKAEAVNDGIVYLMIIPYLLVAAIGYFIYKTGKNLAKKAK
jgi:heme/copper-type cytochrome/quinol oxidase subunit 2